MHETERGATIRGTGGFREWARRTQDRIVASDPGLGNLRQAGTGVLAMGTALALEYGFSLLIHAGRSDTLIAMLLGAVAAMMASMGLTGPASWEKVRTAVFYPVALGIGLLAGVAVGGNTDLMLAVFVVVMFVAVLVRRFGAAFFFYGFMCWMGYFFAAFLGAKLAMLPLLLLEVTIASAWVLLLSMTVLHHHPRRTVRRMLRAFGARARAVAAVAADLLEADPADQRRRWRLRKRLRAHHLRLAECALMVDASLGDLRAAPAGWPAAALRRHLVDAQLAVDALALSAESLAAGAVDPGRSAPLLAQAARAVRLLGASDYPAAQYAARALADLSSAAARHGDLDEQRDGGATAGEVMTARAARRAGTAVLEYVELARVGAGPPAAHVAEDFEPAVMMMMGLLPGSPAVARDVAPRARRWNPLARLDLVSRQAVQVALAGGLAIVLGRELSETRYYWAVLAAFLAFSGTATRSETFIKAGNRVLGTLVGLFASIWLVEATAGNTALVLLVILASMFCGFYLLRISYAFMIFFVTIMVGQLYSVLHEFTDGLLVLRLEETAIGAAIGVAVALLVAPTSTRDTVRAARANLLISLADLLTAAARRIDPAAARRIDPAAARRIDPAAARRIDPGSAAAGPDPVAQEDVDGLARSVEDRIRQLNVVAAPMTRPMLWNNDPRRVRRALTLYAASATYARAIAVQLRRAPQAPVRLAAASAALASAARLLAGPVAERPEDRILDELTAADALLFDPATPDRPDAHPAARPLIHLQQLLHELATGDFSADTVLDVEAVAAGRRAARRVHGRVRITGVITGPWDEPVTTASVTVIDETGRQVAFARPDRAGRYTVCTPAAGTYLVLVTGPHRQPAVERIAASDLDLTHDVVLPGLPAAVAAGGCPGGEPAPGRPR